MLDLDDVSSPYGKYPIGTIVGNAGTAALALIAWAKHALPAFVDPAIVADVDWGKTGTGAAVGIAAIGTAFLAITSKARADRREDLKQLKEIERLDEKERNDEALRKAREENALLQASRAHEIAELKDEVADLKGKLAGRDAEITQARLDRDFLHAELNRARAESEKQAARLEASDAEILRMRKNIHDLRDQMQRQPVKADAAHMKAQKTADKVKDLKGELAEKHVIEVDPDGSDEHEVK